MCKCVDAKDTSWNNLLELKHFLWIVYGTAERGKLKTSHSSSPRDYASFIYRGNIVKYILSLFNTFWTQLLS